MSRLRVIMALVVIVLAAINIAIQASVGNVPAVLAWISVIAMALASIADQGTIKVKTREAKAWKSLAEWRVWREERYR